MLSDAEYETLGHITLVIVADSIVLQSTAVHLLSKQIDMTERRHVDELVAAIRPLIKDVVVYDAPSSFIDAAAKHKDHLILPDWSGADSWSRTGIVPAICEGYGLRYVGADAYTKIVCHDKFLSKSLCSHVGLAAPAALFVDNESKLEAIDFCSFPSVVKPCFEGSSIGVDDQSLVRTPSQARMRAAELLHALNAPILVEQFCPGREVSLCLLGGNDDFLAEAGERYIPGEDSYFETNVFSFELKKNSKRTALRLATTDVPPTYFEQAKRLFKLLRKVDILRVDGRLHGGVFKVIELTPETHLGARAEYCGTFILAGMNYTQVIAKMLLSALGSPQRREANRQT